MKSAVKNFDNSGGIYLTNDQEFRVPMDPLTDWKFRSRFIENGFMPYELPEEYDLIQKYITKDSGVIELGGCIGVMSCFVDKLLGSSGKQVVIEANPKMISYLEENRDRNNAKFKILHGAVSDKDSVRFFLHEMIVGGSNLRETSTSVDVPGLSSLSLLETYPDTRNLIIDIEGGELEFLKKHSCLLAIIETVFIELHPFSNMLNHQQSAECETMLYINGFTKIDAATGGFYQVWKRLQNR